MPGSVHKVSEFVQSTDALPGQHQPSPPTTHTPATITVPSFILKPTYLKTQFPKKSGKFPIELMVSLWGKPNLLNPQ